MRVQHPLVPSNQHAFGCVIVSPIRAGKRQGLMVEGQPENLVRQALVQHRRELTLDLGGVTGSHHAVQPDVAAGMLMQPGLKFIEDAKDIGQRSQLEHDVDPRGRFKDHRTSSSARLTLEVKLKLMSRLGITPMRVGPTRKLDERGHTRTALSGAQMQRVQCRKESLPKHFRVHAV